MQTTSVGKSFRQRFVGVHPAGWLSLCITMVFGLLLAFSVTTSFDGGWFWYAHFVGDHIRLYTDLHFSQQPLYVLETLAFQKLFGDGWLASRVQPALHALALSCVLFALSRKIRWNETSRNLLFLAAYFIGIRFEAYRFDDYHVTSDVGMLLCAYLCLTFLPQRDPMRRNIAALLLGILSACVALTRINDGAAISAFNIFAVLRYSGRAWYRSLGYFAFGFLASFGIVFAVLGDSPSAWFENSILHVGALKGGTSQVILDPLLVPLNALGYFWRYKDGNLIDGGFVPALLAALGVSLVVVSARRRFVRSVFAFATLLVVGYATYVYRAEYVSGTAVLAWLSLLVPLAYVLAAYYLTRMRRLDIVIILPCLLIVGGSLSSAGHFEDLYLPVALLLLVLPIVFFGMRARSGYVALVGMIGLAACSYRVADPFSWNNLKTAPLLRDRSWIRQPLYGPTYIETHTAQLMSSTCDILLASGKRSLLSVPFPFANYYCGISPWNHVVTTWYDTTNADVIADMLRSLDATPPAWVLYTREPQILRGHELAFNGGRELPQRKLDTYFLHALSQGRWKPAYLRKTGPDSTWLLIDTRPAGQVNPNILLSKPSQTWKATRDLAWHASAREFTVERGGTGLSESIAFLPLQFPTAATVRITGMLSQSHRSDSGNANTAPGYGQAVDVYDVDKDAVVGTSGYVNGAQSTPYAFLATVVPNDHYQLRLRYQSADANAKFTLPQLRTENGEELVNPSSAWTLPQADASWHTANAAGSAISLSYQGGTPVKSSYERLLDFPSAGTVEFSARVRTRGMQPPDGVGYVFDISDGTRSLDCLPVAPEAGSGGVYRVFCTLPSAGRYHVAIRYEGAGGSVEFSQLALRYVHRP